MSEILEVKQVHDYNAFVGQKDTHPLVSVIEYAKVSPIYYAKICFHIYALFLLDDTIEDLSYGCSGYDYKNGTLVCVAPGQAGGTDYNGEKFERRGWALLFSPELIHGTSLYHSIRSYTFFAYQANEALHMTREERGIIISLMRQLRHELKQSHDENQKPIIVSYIELILNFCQRFYKRQFTTRKMANSDVLARFERFIKAYYDSDRPRTMGMLTVQHCAKELCISPNYFSDLVRRETGKSPKKHIHSYVVDVTQNSLIAGEQLAHISERLGFEYPQHLHRLFKNVTGETPMEYFNRMKKDV